MNLALWKKAVDDAWRQLALSILLLTLFSWLYVWLMSHFQIGAWSSLLKLLPDFVQPLMHVPVARLATPLGQLSILFVHLITLLVCAAWALGRGSDSISGEISRGTMDLILSLPVWRVTVIFVPAVMAAIGSALLAAALLAGIGLGLHFVKFEGNVALQEFLPGAVNLFCMTFCLTGLTTGISSWNRDRLWTIGIAGAFYIVSLIVKMIARLWPAGAWLGSLSFLNAFQPQELVLMPDVLARYGLQYNLTLVGVGLAGYGVAAIVFSLRDIPGPR